MLGRGEPRAGLCDKVQLPAQQRAREQFRPLLGLKAVADQDITRDRKTTVVPYNNKFAARKLCNRTRGEGRKIEIRTCDRGATFQPRKRSSRRYEY